MFCLPFGPISMQKENGSPDIEDGQAHDGMWLLTVHIAFVPQAPGHGSTHFPPRHVRVGAHSPFVLHSNRHPK